VGTVTCVRAEGIEVELAAPRCEGCSGLCAWRMPRAQHMTFATRQPLAVGDSVVVAVPDRYLLLASMLVYGLPLAGLLGGALAGLAALGSDLGAAVGAAVGIASAVLVAPALRSRVERGTLSRMQLRASGDAYTHSL
jgi:sigma-E factor negative regulatory protein RseC